MARSTVCLKCGETTTNGSRCPRHSGGARHAPRTTAYRDPRYVQLRRRVLAEHRRAFGPRCPRCLLPEDGTVARRLTLNHTQPLGLGGDILGSTTVCCTSCNSKQQHIDRPELARRGRPPRQR